jgi:hypothetical protein
MVSAPLVAVTGRHLTGAHQSHSADRRHRWLRRDVVFTLLAAGATGLTIFPGPAIRFRI